MNNFSISQLARFSGIKQHTIRMWEQRYDALKPHRSEGNTRYYDNSHLRRLLNIVSLSAYGHKVSDLCVLSDRELFGMVQQVPATAQISPVDEYYISQLLSAGLSYDEEWFEKIFAHALLRYPMKQVYTDIIYPMMNRVGLMWSADEIPPANEHFISNLLRQKLFTAIDSLPPPKAGSGTWACFLPEDEFHEIGLLFASWLIRSAGHSVIYLGTNVPMGSLEGLAASNKIDQLLTFLVKREAEENTSSYFKQLSDTFKTKKIYVAAGEQGRPQGFKRSNVQWLATVQELEQVLQSGV